MRGFCISYFLLLMAAPMLFRRALYLPLCLLAACESPDLVQPDNGRDRPPIEEKSYPYISAHRAGAAYAPENTMMAIRNTRRLGIEDIELDIQLTLDGVLVFLHDDTLDRTTDCTGAVNAMTWAQMQNCDAAYWFTPGEPVTRVNPDGEHPLRGQGITMPTADELFSDIGALTSDTETVYTIEIKNVPSEANFDPSGTQVATALVSKIQEYGLQDRIIVQSFWPVSLNVTKQLDSGLKTLFLSSESVSTITARQNIQYCQANGFDISASEFDSSDMNAETVQIAHDAGLLMVPWTADRAEDLSRMGDIGVDGVITNFPACALQQYQRDEGLPVLAPEIGGANDFPACPE